MRGLKLLFICVLSFFVFSLTQDNVNACAQKQRCEASCTAGADSFDESCAYCDTITCETETDTKKQKYDKCLSSCNAVEGTVDKANEYCECKCGGGITLNTDLPFIGRCIDKRVGAGSDKTNAGNAFPRLLAGLIQIVFGAVIIVGFLAILVGGFMITAEGAAESKAKGLALIKKVLLGFLIIGLSGVILNLINPNFFAVTTPAGLLFIW